MNQTAALSKVDELIKDQFVPFRERLTEQFAVQHPNMSAVISALLSNKENKFGMQVTENGQVVGEYTFHFKGIHINDTEYGKLDSGIHHPFLGVVKPYSIIERSALEKIMADEPNLQNLQKNLFSGFAKYLPNITFKFLQ
jgi:hypothetical protein